MNNAGNEHEMCSANNYVSEAQCKKNGWMPITEISVVFAKVGAAIMLNRKRLVRISFLLDNNTMAYKFGTEWDIDFGKTLFERIDLTDLVQIGALPSYNATDVECVEISMPDKPEQHRIGVFFKQLDNLITLHQRKQIKQNLGVLPEKCCTKITNSWEQRKVNEVVASVDTGRSHFQAKMSGKYEILGSTAVIGYDDEFDYQGEFLLTARVGANAGTLYRHSGKVKISDNTVFLQGNNLDFMYYALFNYDLKKLSFGTGQPLVKASELKKLSLILPSSEKEKKYVGRFFEQIDNLITLHQCKYFNPFSNFSSHLVCFEKYKKANSWEQCELGKIANEVTRTDPESTAPIMMITANNGFIEQSDRYAFDNAGESLKKYILLEKGELAYNHGASKLRPYGSCFALTTVEKARIPFVYHCFSAKNYNSEFLSIELNGENVEKQLRRIVSSGARMDGLLNISFTEYSTITLSLPKRKEQDKISNFFSILDNLITLHQRKLKDFHGGFL